MNELNYFDKIYRYTSDELSEKEAADFKQELASNPDLYYEYEVYKKVEAILKDKELMHYYNLIQKIRIVYSDFIRELDNYINGNFLVTFQRVWFNNILSKKCSFSRNPSFR